MNSITTFAPAKLNLYLHITGRQPNGYHDLDSLVAFANIGDEIRLQPAHTFSFTIEGPQAATLAYENPDHNLAVQAARSLAELTSHTLDIALTLHKRLPVASGIGGGSSDAAAVLRALAEHWGLSPDDPRLIEAAQRHGQDVPVCLKTENNYMTATGTVPAPALPRTDVVLVNPGKGLPTPDVFKEYRHGGDAFSALARLDQVPVDTGSLVKALHNRTNDLYASACRLMPEVAEIIRALNDTPDCLLARMSGSGATCFGLYADARSAAAATVRLRAAHPGWWIEEGAINA